MCKLCIINNSYHLSKENNETLKNQMNLIELDFPSKIC